MGGVQQHRVQVHVLGCCGVSHELGGPSNLSRLAAQVVRGWPREVYGAILCLGPQMSSGVALGVPKSQTYSASRSRFKGTLVRSFSWVRSSFLALPKGA